MSLAAGDRLGPYEILEPLGAGGMGEVIARGTRAWNAPSPSRSSPGTWRRTSRRSSGSPEARAASALNHPHICTIFDVGADPPYLAMEPLEGETLQRRLAREHWIFPRP